MIFQSQEVREIVELMQRAPIQGSEAQRFCLLEDKLALLAQRGDQELARQSLPPPPPEPPGDED